MVQVICQKTGIEFESSSKRVKNHPAIMSMVEKANKEKWYGQCMDALAAGREAKLETIEQFIELLNETRTAALEQQSINYTARLEQKRRDREMRAALYQAWREGRYEYPREDDERDSALDALEGGSLVNGTSVGIDDVD